MEAEKAAALAALEDATSKYRAIQSEADPDMWQHAAHRKAVVSSAKDLRSAIVKGMAAMVSSTLRSIAALASLARQHRVAAGRQPGPCPDTATVPP